MNLKKPSRAHISLWVSEYNNELLLVDVKDALGKSTSDLQSKKRVSSLSP